MAKYRSISKDGTPVEITTKYKGGIQETKIKSAIRLQCQGCDQKYWAWPEHEGGLCARCMMSNSLNSPNKE